MLDFTQCDWIDLTKLTRYHQNLMSFLSENYLNKSGGTMNGQINSCSILPKSPSSYNLGSSTNQWSNIYSNGFVLVDSTGQIRPNSTGTGNIGTSSYYWGNAYINNITSGTIVPKTDNIYDLGSSTYKWKDAYINNIYGIAIYQNGNQVWDKSNLQVGGVNRFKQLASPNRGSLTNNNKSWQFTATTSLGDTDVFFRLYDDLKVGDIITISCDVSGFASDSDYIRFGIESQSSTPYLIIKNGRCSITHTMSAAKTANSNILLDDYTKSISAEATVTLSNFKVEYGNTPTTYSPAPEDTDSLIATAQSTANTAVSNASTAQAGVNTLKSSKYPIGETLNLTAKGRGVQTFSSGSSIINKEGFNITTQNTVAVAKDPVMGEVFTFPLSATNKIFVSDIISQLPITYYIRFKTDFTYKYTDGSSCCLMSNILTYFKGFVLGYNHENGKIWIDFGNTSYSDTITLNSNTILDSNKWHDVCFTVNSNQIAKIYINGEFKNSVTLDTDHYNVLNNITGLHVNSAYGTYNNYVANAPISCVKVWNNRVLTDEEILALYLQTEAEDNYDTISASNAQLTANTAVTNLNNINLMTTASVDALFNLTSATNALESVQTMDSDDITDILHDR